MMFLSVIFALAVLTGSQAALPDVGSCTFLEYHCDALKCKTRFIKQLQKDPKGDCSAKFTEMARCVNMTIQICTDNNWLSDIDGIGLNDLEENQACYDSALEIPTAQPKPSGSPQWPCSASYSSAKDDCTRNFKQKYAADKSDPSLCQERAKAKQCEKKLLDSECTFSSVFREVLNLAYGDWNPYCDNNRDPGATGNDQCDDVREQSV